MSLGSPKPQQNIPESRKDKEWNLKNIHYYIGLYNNQAAVAQRELMNRNWRVYTGDIAEDEFNYLMYPEGQADPTLTVQAVFKNYQLAYPLIQQRIGEFLGQKLNISVDVVNREAVLSKQERKAAIMAEKIAKKLLVDIEREAGISIPVEDRSALLPDDLRKLEHMKIRDSVEDIMLNGIHYLIDNYELKEIYRKGLESYLITNQVFFINERLNNDPVARNLKPMNVGAFLKEDDDNVRWGEAYIKLDWFSIPQVMDNHQLNDEQVAKIQKLQTCSTGEFEDLFISSGFGGWWQGEGYNYFYRNIGQQDAKVLVVSLEWRSLNHIYIKKSKNQFTENSYFHKRITEKEYAELSEKEQEGLEKVPYYDLRKATMIGHDMLIDSGRVKDQQRREQWGIGRVPLSICGVAKNPMQALMTILAPLQMEYSIGWFHIERLLAQAGGKAIELWMHNKPTGWTDEKWLFYGRHKGVIVREYDEEVSMLPGADRSMQQAIDLGLANSFQYLIQYVQLIETTAYRLAGTNPAAQGFLKGDELVGNVQANLVQSSTVAQGIYYDLNRAIEQQLNDAADKIKSWWTTGDTKVWITDREAIALKVTADMPNYEYAVFVKNDANDIKAQERLEQLAGLALQSGGAEFLDVLLEMDEGENAAEKRAIVKKGMKAIRERQQMLQEEGIKAQNAMAQAKAEENAIKREESQMKAQTDIGVAQINKQAKVEVKKMDIEFQEAKDELDKAEAAEERASSEKKSPPQTKKTGK